MKQRALVIKKDRRRTASKAAGYAEKASAPAAEQYCVREPAAVYPLGGRPAGADDTASHRSYDAAVAGNDGQAAARRAARLSALTASSGIWHDGSGARVDGLVVQEAMRAEWR